MALASVLPGVLWGQPLQLTLDKAIEMALADNHELEVARLAVDKADADVTEAFGYALPTLDLTASYTRTLKIPSQSLNFGGEQVFIEFGTDNAVNSRLSLRQTIFNSAVFTGVGTARTYQKAAREQLAGAAAKIVLDVKKAYYAALLAREAWKLQESSLKNAEDNYRDVSVLFREGLVSEYDAIRSEVQVENLRPGVLQAENAYVDTRNGLKVLLGIDSRREIEVVDELRYTPESAPGGTLVSIQEEAVRGNYDIRTLELQKEVNVEMISINRSEFLPTLEFFGNYTFIDAQANSFDALQNRSSAAVGLEFNLSLFNGFRSSAKVEKARRDYMQSEEQYEQLSKAVETRVASVLNTMQTSMRRVAAQERTVDQAQRGYDIARTRYKEGIGDQLEVNDADQQLRQARLNRVSSIHDYLVALAELDELQGKLESKYLELVQTD